MSLIVEDGTIVGNAESYCSVAAADTYHANMGNESWSDVENKEAMLRRATAYLTQKYRGRWKGVRKSSDQVLDWPRSGAPLPDAASLGCIPDNTVPDDIVKACAELALRANTSDLMADQGRVAQSESVGEISVVYAKGDRNIVSYRSIESLLGPYLARSGISIPLVRV